MARKGWLEDREHVLEEEYFWRRERDLIARLREEGRRERERRVLADQLGDADEAFLAKLQSAGFTPDNLVLLHLVPLVEVGWAAGDVGVRERELILAMAVRRGVAPNTPAYARLTGWLDHRPDTDFFDTAGEAIRLVLEYEDPETRTADQQDLVDSCTRIAEATGEILGLVRISRGERECIQRIVHRLTEKRKTAAARPKNARSQK